MTIDSSSSTLRLAATVLGVVIGGASLIAYSHKKKNTPKEEETWESHCTGHGPLKEVWNDTLFVVEAEGCEYGPPTRNMAIYRVPDKSRRLVVYNGIAVNEPTMTQIEELGTPTVMVVPNCYHRCCAAVWKKRFPDIMVVCPSVAKDKVSEVVQVDETTEAWSAMPEWEKWIHTKTIDGWGDFESVIEVELEKQGGTGKSKKAVLVCDLLFTVPYDDEAGYASRLAFWAFDSYITLPPQGCIIVPKVARISRIFAIQDWPKAEQWYRMYAQQHGPSIAAIVCGHGVVVEEIDPQKGCAEALEGVADQLTKPRW